jgi:hypothetical protein
MRVLFHALNIVIIAILAFSAGYTAKDANVLANPEETLPLAPRSVEERASPDDIIQETDIKVYKDRIVINVEGAIWARFADTDSMDPVIDAGANGLELPITDPSVLKVGDIVSYIPENSENSIIHRIVYIGYDQEGS